MREVAFAFAQVMRTGSEAQIAKAREVLARDPRATSTGSSRTVTPRPTTVRTTRELSSQPRPSVTRRTRSAGSRALRPPSPSHGLVKRYDEVEAVRGIDFECARGEIFGFLGPNGAGKSTTINMLCTLVRPSGGSARVAGHDVVSERDEVRRNIGLVFQDTTLDGYLTAEQNLRLHAELYGVPREAVRERMRQVMEMVGLWERRGEPA